MLLLFLYINKKFCFENVGGFPDLGSGYGTRKNSQDKICKYRHCFSYFFFLSIPFCYFIFLNIHGKVGFDIL